MFPSSSSGKSHQNGKNIDQRSNGSTRLQTTQRWPVVPLDSPSRTTGIRWTNQNRVFWWRHDSRQQAKFHPGTLTSFCPLSDFVMELTARLSVRSIRRGDIIIIRYCIYFAAPSLDSPTYSVSRKLAFNVFSYGAAFFVSPDISCQ